MYTWKILRTKAFPLFYASFYSIRSTNSIIFTLPGTFIFTAFTRKSFVAYTFKFYTSHRVFTIISIVFNILNIDINYFYTKIIQKTIRIGGTQTLFRNLPKVSNFGKTLGPSYSGSKIVSVHKIWNHRHILESSNRLYRLEIIDWEKLPLKSKFSKTVGTIVISVQRISG